MLVLKLKAPPFSINEMYYRSGNRTIEARAWADSIFPQLEEQRHLIQEFSEKFLKVQDSKALSVELLFLMPNLFTKTGKVSRHSKDCTNIEKPLVDLLFDKRYKDRGLASLGIDDCVVTKLVSEKWESESFEILVKIEIIKPVSLVAIR